MRSDPLSPLIVLVLASCSTATAVEPDARRTDASAIDAAQPDAADTTDAMGLDGDPPDGPTLCGISLGQSPSLDGDGDLAAYLASQVLTPGVPLAGADRVAITWDRANLYVTATSASFASAFKPLHVYVETGTSLAAATSTMGKEYGGDTPVLPFTPTHVVAIRRQDDSGVGGPYDGVYTPTPGPAWSTRTFPLAPGTHVYVSADGLTLSVRAPWTALGGCPTRMRLAAHVVHGDAGNDWKDTVPTTHTPWLAPGGGYYQVDLTGDPAIAGWSLP